MSWIRKWKRNKKKYSWGYIEKACKSIAFDLYESDISRIIGLSRGGLIPATIIANSLGVREVYSIGLASYELTHNGVEAPRDDIRVYQRLPSNCPKLNKREKVLIVDDISDKGHTFEHVINNLTKQYQSTFMTASIFIKPSTSYLPDMFYSEVPDEQWVVFPWED